MWKIITWFKNLKFRSKILVICLLSSILPVVALGSYCYYQIQHILINREGEVLEESLNQAISSIDYKVTTYTNVINQIVWNEDVKRGVTTEYDNSYEMYVFYRDILDPLSLNNHFLYSEINTITIFSDNPMYSHGDILRPLTNIEQKSWFDQILETSTPKFVVSAADRTFEVVSQIFDRNHSITNVVYIDIDYEHVFDNMSRLFENNYGLVILDENNKLVYTFQDFQEKYKSYELTTNELLKKLNAGSLQEDFVFKGSSSTSYGWTAYLYRPLDTIYASTYKITVTIFIVILLCVVILFLSIYFLSKFTVRPLEKLEKNMELIEKGDLSVTVANSSTDEIGNLIRRFSNMVNKLQEMINEVYKSKIAKQEYEMKALQAQINPHFFYNSLSLINSKAIIAEQEDISKMAQLLSTFYRTTLNRGKNTISVREELENTTSYVQIQRMMHSDSFDVRCEVDEEILDYTMLNLLLQPLVENAINHGIDHKESPGKAVLTITAKQSDNNLIFSVSDNGCGMEPELLKTILTTKTKGYGVQNVHHRIQLTYGVEYGLTYTSKLMRGTTVTLTIPKVN
ncbi:two-component system sensor histidine kinase YesM [Bacillus niacini]|uniref:histidine kinase n=1 Tax=Neobacillus niacini TaxID=86668 RepID=A0A852TBY9_9BACI|nr:histidine kinase [Neobacillus niacini]NYE05721.1 two-component system sensor histidine kinase YesM [Neobacillus niacini]